MSNTTDQQVLKLTTKPDYNLIADHKQGWLTDHKIDYNLIADHKLMIDHYNF